MMAIGSHEEAAELAREATRILRSLEGNVAGLRIEPSRSPLAHALENISRLHDASEEIVLSAEDGETTRTFIEASRQQLAQAKQILAKAVEEERQR